MRKYVMTRMVLTRLLNRTGLTVLSCRRPLCGKPVRVGDVVVSKPHQNSGSFKTFVWHLRCYEKMCGKIRNKEA